MRAVALVWTVLAVAGCPGVHDRSDGGRPGLDAPEIPVDAPMPDVALADTSSPLDAAPPADAPPALDARMPLDAPRPADASPGGVGTGRSFVLAFALDYTGPGLPTLPTTLSGTAHFAPVAGGDLEATLGMPGIGWRIAIRPEADGTIELPVVWTPLGTLGDCAPVMRVQLTARVRLLDDDGDGLADRLDGTATGMLEHLDSDFMMSEHAFVAMVFGDVEHDAPRFEWLERVPGHVPLARTDAPTLVSSEPFPTPASAWLEAPDGRRVALEARDSITPGVAGGFRLVSDVPLPFDVDLVLHTDGTVADLDGHPAAPAPPLSTLPLPSPVALEGFEAAGGHLDGDAERVSGLGTLPAISGARSVLVPALDRARTDGAEVAVRLVVPPGALRVRMRARYLASFAFPGGGWGAPPIDLRVFALDGSESRLDSGPEATMRVATGDAEWVQASEVVDLDVPLPSGASGEVVVIVGRRWGCLGMIPWLPTTSLLVDDIRVE